MCVLPSRALAHLEAFSGALARRSKLSLLACAAISVACVAACPLPEQCAAGAIRRARSDACPNVLPADDG